MKLPVTFPRFFFGISELAAAGIVGASSIGSGFITSAGSKRAVRESAKYNKMMYAQQRADYLSDVAHAEEYNSPAAQRRRLEEAGLNPYFMLDGSSAGTAQSPANIGANPVDYANVSEPIGAGVQSGVQNALSMYMEMKAAKNADDMAKSQIQGVNLDNYGKYLDNQYQAASLLSRIGLSKYQVKQAMADFDFSQKMNPLNIQTQQQQLQNLQDTHSLNEVNLTLSRLSSIKEGIALKYLEPGMQLEIVNKMLTIENLYQSGLISKEHYKQEVQNTANLIQESAVKKMSPSEIAKMRSAVYDAAMSELELKEYNNRIQNPESGEYGPGQAWLLRGLDKVKHFNPIRLLK